MKKIFLALLLMCSNAFAAITDGKFGINQIFDVQYWWDGTTLNASNFIAPYNKNFQTVTVTTGQYFQFFASTTNPGTYGLKLMNSDGTQHSIVHDTGEITALGSGAIFYIGSGFFGNVITTGQGYNYGDSAQFTNMDTEVTSSDLDNYTYASSTPLAAGETAAPAGGGSAAPVYTSNITTTQQTMLDDARTRRNAIGLGNRIDLYSDGSGNTIDIEQVGNYNRVQGLGGAGTNAHVAGFGTAVDIKQGDTLSGRNLIELYVQGNGNNVTLSQARNTSTGAVDGQESGGHIARVSITGNVGTYVFRQGNDGGASSGHFLNYTMSGSGGTHTVKQSNNGEKLAFISITGNNNNETVQQSGTGNHFLDLTLTGNNNSANITQKDSGSHKATINLTNAGGASSATLVQQGSTPQIYSITQQCATLSGCSVSVTQGN